ncbi:MAG: hypothetical protein RDU24_11785 [Humidesulfovibrio sp.]|uniref:ABC-three component system protein n=1 Tax=Humidesulfovibrio sp. TaxID=2910988 RepID=UPI0027EDD4AD|nr:ABC-three component system protein [Humidesulfovibrio sp.]MDQ7836054.1 hypothetical protein [Humidesulfovibrio sp.]
MDWVAMVTAQSMPDLSFEELNQACEGIATYAGNYRELTIVPPQAKLERNKLGAESHMYITMGMAVGQNVRDFLAAMEQTVPDFSSKLVTGLRVRYADCYNAGYRGDRLFEAMISLLDRPTLQMKAANIAIVSYFFELCDIFEK